MRTKSRWSAILGALCVVLLGLPLGGGCSSDEASVKVYTPDEQGVSECVADHPDKAADCAQSLQGAQKEQEATAEHFNYDTCSERFGPNACVERGGYYAPAMAGFMFGAMVGNSILYHPVYVDRWGSAYSGTVVLGTFRTGSTHIYVTPAPNAVWVKQYNYTTVSIPRSTPSAAPSFAAPAAPGQAPKIQRGGTGGSAAIATVAPPPSKPPAVAPGATTASLPPPGAIQRGNTGGSAAGSTAAPPTVKRDDSQQHSPPPGGIQRGNTGGSAATTVAGPPPSPPRTIIDHSDPPEHHMTINRGNTGGSTPPTRASSPPPSSSSSGGSSSSRSSSTSSGKGR